MNIQAKSKRKAQIVKEGQKNKNRITAWMEKVVKDERIANLWTRIKNFHSIVEPYFIYKKEIPRAFRFTVLFLRFMFMCAVSGVLARMSVDFAVFAGILAATSLLMRFVSMKLNDLIKRSHENHRWRGC